MATEAVLMLSIGAVVQSSLMAAFGGANKAITTLGNEIDSVSKKHVELGNSIQKHMGNLSASTIAPMVKQYEHMGAAIEKARINQIKLGEAVAAHKTASAKRSEMRGEFREQAGTAAAVFAPLGMSVRAYMEQEQAATDMKIAFMKAGGGVSDAFAEVQRQAVELGNQFPGTTADFLRLGQTLKEQGVKDSAVTNGGLRAAASFNVLMNTPQEMGGEIVAKLMEARGIDDVDLPKAVDQMQRAKFAFGMKPEELKVAMQYDAPTANILGLKGLGNSEKLLALQGMGAQQGLEGSSWGTNFAMMLTNMAKKPDAIMNATKGSKAHSRGMIEQAGVSFDFFDKSGKFGGVDNMVAQLEKLRIIKEKFGEQGALTVANDMFGAEAGRVAMILADKGTAGLEANLKKMREQASLQERMAEKSKTLANAWESMTGTITNGMASIGEVFSGDLQGFFTDSNAFISDTLVPWVKENKGLIKTGVELVGGLMAARIGVLGLRYGFNLLWGPVRGIATAFRMFRAGASIISLMRLGELSKTAGVLRMFGMSAENAAIWSMRLGKAGTGLKKFAGSKLGKGLGAAAGAYGLYTIARDDMDAGTKHQGKMQTAMSYGKGAMSGAAIGMMFGPIGAVVGAAVGLVYTAVVRNWSAVKNYTVKTFGAMKSYLSTTWESIKKDPVKALASIGATILNWSPIGLFYKAFAAVMSYFGVSLPSSFTGFGKMIMDGLLNGISSMYNTVVDKITSIGKAIKSAFTGAGAGGQDIHSPSRIWHGFGRFVGMGLGGGIDAEAGGVVARVQRLGNSIKNAFTPQTLLTKKVDASFVESAPRPSVRTVGTIGTIFGGFDTESSNVLARIKQLGTGIKNTFAAKLKAPIVDTVAKTVASSGSNAKSNGMTIHFNPTIQLSTNGKGDAQSQVAQAMQYSMREFETMMKRLLAEQTRRAF